MGSTQREPAKALKSLNRRFRQLGGPNLRLAAQAFALPDLDRTARLEQDPIDWLAGQLRPLGDPGHDVAQRSALGKP